MLKKVKIIKKDEAAQVTLFIGGTTKALTDANLSDDEARLIMQQYPETFGLFFEDKKPTPATAS
ncbi:hypothetical protein [Siphonobacter curvatus]|uniref:Uncharacterized protein n=1 Tax=Siphonobacter curvatus TaxID=2094562 RepID=A0A2S7IN68_9BACT|nr:hypothetical protein [Siphonobacter curvatus]PQA59174.1 hypothetical protein C5O19_05825 [Siphonobacter curvatus]